VRVVDPTGKKPVVTVGPLTRITSLVSSIAEGAVHEAEPKLPAGILTLMFSGQFMIEGGVLSVEGETTVTVKEQRSWLPLPSVKV